ncbi:substrate-binding domain-containing protein [Micromonospora sp. NPDC048830]
MAIGVLSALRARGIPVPERISVAGFDDYAAATASTTNWPAHSPPSACAA